MWLDGVVVRRYIHILTIILNFPYSTCIRSFLGSSILTSLFIFKMFFRSLYIVLELATASLFLPFCLCGGVCGWNNDKGLCSKLVHINCVDRVVDGPHGW